MNSYVQLILMIFSFCYGNLIFVTNRLQEKLFKHKNLIIRLIGNILYINIMALFYLLVLYKLNCGSLHIYFILLIFSGYIVKSVKYCK